MPKLHKLALLEFAEKPCTQNRAPELQTLAPTTQITDSRMHYDISSKILMEKCREEILRRMVGLSILESTLLEQLPQETVSLKRSDFPILVTDEQGKQSLVLLEVQSEWQRDVPLRLLDYRSRYLLQQKTAKAISCVLLLRPSDTARGYYGDNEVTFRFRLVKVYELDAREVVHEGVACLMPFVPLMRHGEELMEEADRLALREPLAAGRQSGYVDSNGDSFGACFISTSPSASFEKERHHD